MLIRRASVAVLLSASFLATSAAAKDVEEKYDGGTAHLRYKTDEKNRKNGDYQELFENGKIKVRGSYAVDKKNGSWTTYSEGGKTLEVAHWRNGMLEGPYQVNFPSGHAQLKANYHADDFAGPISTFDDKGHALLRVSYPRPMETVLKAWNALAPRERQPPKYLEEPKVEAPYRAGKIATESLQAAAKYVMLYRFLTGVPFQNIVADPALCDMAQHGAVLVAKLGHLTHTPEKPADMDEPFFKLAYAGCNQSNLHQGQATLFDAIDGFMDDSDASNIEKIGHRQWVLAPGLQKTGFGSANGFTAMHVLDGARAGGNFAYIAYPSEGYFPLALLHPSTAWSLHLNSAQAKVSSAAVTITVARLDEHFIVGDETSAKIVSVLPNPTSNWTVIVFQPDLKSLEPGRYLVRVGGIRTQSGAAGPFSYMVDLKQIPEPKDATEKTEKPKDQ